MWGWSDTVRLISRWRWSARCSQCNVSVRAGTGRSLQSLLPAHLGHHVDPWLVWAVVMLVSPDSGTKSNISILLSAMVFVLVLDWMYFTTFLNSISLLIYWHSAWPVWPGNAPWQTDPPPLPSSDVSWLGPVSCVRCRAPECPLLTRGVGLSVTQCCPDSRPGHTSATRHNTRVQTETRDTQGSEWRKLEDDLSFNLNKKDSYKDSSTIVLFVTNWMFQIVIE